MSTLISRLVGQGLVLAAALACMAAPARAEDFPRKPITIVVPFGPGSGSDIAARFYARALKDKLDAMAVVELKPGAAGMIAAQSVAKASPDGYTVLMGSGTVNAANYPLFREQARYKPEQFAAVATIYVTPPVLFASKKLEGASVGELMAQAKRSNRKLSCGSGNAVTQVACELLHRKADADMVNVPYKGNGQSMTDLASGQIDLAFADLAAGRAFLSRKDVRPIAVPAGNRLPSIPDVPTFAEQGISDFEFLSWNTIFVPAGTPQEAIRKLNEAARHMLASPEWEQMRTTTSGFKVSGDTTEAEAFVKSEVERWERYVRNTGVKGSE